MKTLEPRDDAKAVAHDAPAPAGGNALVFSGGGIKFATHIGVIAEMEHWTVGDASFLDKFDVVVGTSAGAVFGALYASGLSPAQIAFFARMFAHPADGKRLFDPNWAGAGAAFIRHEARYALGIVRGRAVLTLLEFAFSKEGHAWLGSITPENVTTEPERKALRALLLAKWRAHRRLKRNASFYKNDQMTFEHCTKKLYLIAVNAYTGQKIVFAKRADPATEYAQDLALSTNEPNYINKPGTAELQQRQAELAAEGQAWTLTFQRFENRIYRNHDQTWYGEQLPLAIAVRASLSIPVIFEPVRIRRASAVGATHHEDLFIDGGVDDNFSLSVALDPHIGAARNVLGVSLGDLGYRLPNAKAVTNVMALLQSTTAFMGDAIVDLFRTSSELKGHQVTVVNALPGVASELTNTQAIALLIDDGRTIAQGFWSGIHPGAAYSPDAAVDWSLLFAATGERIYLSPAARGMEPPAMPTPLDGDISPSEIFYVPLLDLRREWVYAYSIVAVASLGAGATLFTLVAFVADWFGGDPLRATGALLANVVLGLISIVVGILLVRLLAFRAWRDSGGPDR